MCNPALRVFSACIVFTACIWMIGCTGGIHRQGDQMVSVVGSYGYPIKGNVIWPDGDGRAENAGVVASYHWFFQDRLALACNLTPYRNYSQSNGDIPTGEYSMGFRYYFTEFDLFSRPVGLYADAHGGLLYAADDVPPGGANMNFTAEAGVGFEYKLTDSIGWVTGYRLRHLSDGYLFATENPSQNDHSVYTGIAITFR